ncbi:transcription termination/antitermination protein NusA [Bacteroidia bacterium]|nr:transcription termination/antitermination protein NusA [Bacteroidia bacterium]
MENKQDNLIENFLEFTETTNINREESIKILKEVLIHVIGKRLGADDNLNAIFNPDRNEMEIQRELEVVADDNITDEAHQIGVSKARDIEGDDDIEVGDDFTEIIDRGDFTRRELFTLSQLLKTKVSEYSKNSIFKKYKDKTGDIINAEVYQVSRKEIIALDEEGIELILPKTEQIPADFYRKGDSLQAVVLKVERNGSNLQIILSRTSPVFLEKLFEQEIPEVFDGLITIKKIVREPGERAKVAVESYNERIDPIGTCVGIKGARIHGIVRELKNENIDVINWTTNPELLITRALSPAKVLAININEEEKTAKVTMKSDQISLAIGKGGFNIRLAGKLAGYDINVYKDVVDAGEEDVDLQEFSDEIDQWMLDNLKSIGCDTAKDVIAMSVDELEKRTDLEREQIEDVLKILNAEFE